MPRQHGGGQMSENNVMVGPPLTDEDKSLLIHEEWVADKNRVLGELDIRDADFDRRIVESELRAQKFLQARLEAEKIAAAKRAKQVCENGCADCSCGQSEKK